jgi:hypothetical protein
LIEAAPFEPPKHETFVCEARVVDIAGGWVIVKTEEAVHPIASVAVHVHDPAVSPVTDVVPSPIGFPGVQLYV